jgi:hypothetical protein
MGLELVAVLVTVLVTLLVGLVLKSQCSLWDSCCGLHGARARHARHDRSARHALRVMGSA